MLPLIALATALAAEGTPPLGSAWLYDRGSVLVDVGAGGTTTYELGAVVGVRLVPIQDLELGINLAHAGLGLFGGHLRGTVWKDEQTALTLQGGLMGYSLGLAWYLPEIEPDVDDALDGVSMLMIPASVTLSREVGRVGLDLGLGWDQTWVTGRPTSEVLVLDGGIGVRRGYVAPGVRVQVHRNVRIAARTSLPFYAAARTVIVATYEVEEGVQAGARSSDWFALPFGRVATGRLTVEWSHKRSRLALGLSSSAVVRALGIPAVPYGLWTLRLGKMQ